MAETATGSGQLPSAVTVSGDPVTGSITTTRPSAT